MEAITSGVDRARAKVAIIGGSGFYYVEGLTDIDEVRLTAPFGDPSDAIVVGTFSEQRVAFLPRHGVGHQLAPSELPSLADIYALKKLGVEFVIGVSSVGSLREDIEPSQMVVPDQLIDRTQGRLSTFFGGGLVANVSFAQPFCSVLGGVLIDSIQQAAVTGHARGVYVTIEGPQFSTIAESNLY